VRRALSILTLAALAAACGDRGPVAAAPRRESTATPPRAGIVAIAPDAPLLQQIRETPVRIVELPTDEIVAPGKIEANPNRVSKIVLPVPGRISAVLVRTGDAVRKDQPLLTIQSPDADAAMSTFLSARAGLTQAEAARAKAQADLDRATDLFEHDAVAKKDVLAAENAVAQAKAAFEQAQAVREQAKRRLEVLGLKEGDFDQPVVVRAPLSGKVLDLSVVPGEFRNDTNAPLMTVADLSTVWVTSQVPESYIRFVQTGERVELTLIAYPGQTFEGRVSRIADTVDPQTRTVKVQAEIGNADGRLRPEMYGSIHHIESVAPQPVVPVGAVIQTDGNAVVYVETAPGRFEERAVVVGKRAGDVVRVVRGVSAGETIVSDGAMLLRALRGRGQP
jgi:cobalt-zinc-cadmium efflux system membrane fusion protein